MTDEGSKIILFRSTHDAMRAEGTLIKNGLKPQVVPVPRDVSPDCGIALKIGESGYDNAVSILEEAGVIIAGSVDRPGA